MTDHSVRDWLGGFVLTLLFAASLLNQLPWRPWATFVATADRWTFLPFWSFFAPEPGYSGSHVIYRDRTPRGLTDWAELLVPDTTHWRWMWNPARFERKALQDLVNGLARAGAEIKNPLALELTACHLSLVSWVHSQPPIENDSSTRQFAVLQAEGHGVGRVLKLAIASREYSLDRE